MFRQDAAGKRGLDRTQIRRGRLENTAQERAAGCAALADEPQELVRAPPPDFELVSEPLTIAWCTLTLQPAGVPLLWQRSVRGLCLARGSPSLAEKAL